VYPFEIVDHCGTTLWQHGHFNIQEPGTMNLIPGGVFDHVEHYIDNCNYQSGESLVRVYVCFVSIG
jgi:hypothetical protein